MERRLFERKALSLNAVLKDSAGFHVPCIVQDFCTGGLLVSVSGSGSAGSATGREAPVARDKASFRVADAITVIVSVDDERFEIEAVVARTENEELGLKLKRSNARMIGAFRKLCDRQTAEGKRAGGGRARRRGTSKRTPSAPRSPS